MIELCRHIKPEGTACKGPAVRGSQFCRHHQLIKTTLDKVKPTRKNFGIYTPLPFHFPEDRAAIQTDLFLVLHAFNDRKIDAKAANFMTYNLQVCLSNLSKGGPLAPVDTESAIRRVILTPEGDEIAPPREKLEKDESPVHYKDCPCQRCAEQHRGAAPEQHHADCKCGLCEPISNGCHPEAEQGAAEEPVLSNAKEPAVSPSATDVGAPHLEEMWEGTTRENQIPAISDQNEPQLSTNGCHPERSVTIGEQGAVEEPVLSNAKEPAVSEPATAVEGNHQSQLATLSPRP